MSIKDRIFAAQDLDLIRVPTPEWGGDVFVRQLSMREAMEFREMGKRTGQDVIDNARVAAFAICDENGQRVFTDEDAAALEGKSFAVLTRVVKAWTEANSMSAAEIKDAEKNSSTPPTANSPTSCVSPA